MESIAKLILLLGIINLIRVAFFMVGADIYAVLNAKLISKSNNKRKTLPTFSVIIPAYNEQYTILKTIESVSAVDYPKHKLQVIVVSDGSTDKTLDILKQYQKSHPSLLLEIVSQSNGGKAKALNNAIANYAVGELIMCLDADSYITPEALKRAVKYFQDKSIIAIAANIKVKPNNSLLNSVQRYEYIVGHQLKRAQTAYNIEYVIGGVGSVFRKNRLNEVGLYDSDTLTEDLDLTMKLIKLGNKKWRIVFAEDVIAYTEGVLSLKDLIKQRHRWKFGFLQTLYKHRQLFFNVDSKYNKLLTWFYLPYLIYTSAVFLVEPLLIFYLLYNVIINQNIFVLFYGICFVSLYLMVNVLLERTLPLRERLQLTLLAPGMYVFFYVLTFAEYLALTKSLFGLVNLKASMKKDGQSWQHVERPKLT